MTLRIPPSPVIAKPEDAISKLIELAKVNGKVVMNINDIDIIVEPESSVVDLMRYLEKMRQIYDYLRENGLDTSIVCVEEDSLS